MSRYWLVLCLLLAPLFARAQYQNPVLILIQPLRAGPPAHIETYVHDTWIHWGPSEGEAFGNRILSLLTGQKWHGSPLDFDFRPLPDGRWMSRHADSLRERGYFAAKEATLGVATTVVSGKAGTVSRTALLLGTDASGIVEPISVGAKWPSGRLLIADAASWDEVRAISSRTTGRVLVVEYPVPPGQSWSRAWFQGAGWPGKRIDGAGLSAPFYPEFPSEANSPGLIPAHVVGALLVNRVRPSWTGDPGLHWTGANRWLGFVANSAPIWAGFLGFASILLLATAIRLIGDERRSLGWTAAASAFCLLPGTIAMGGGLARVGGVELWLLWGFLAFGAALALAGLATLILRRAHPSGHPLQGVAWALVFLLATGSPEYSPASGRLGIVPREFAPELYGCLISALVALYAFADGSKVMKGMAISISVAVGLAGFGVATWWSPEPKLAIPPVLLVLVSALPQIGYATGVGLGLATGLVLNGGNHAVFCSGDLISLWSDRNGVDFAPLVRFVFSPAFLAGVFVIVVAAVFTPSFASHQLRRTYRRSSIYHRFAVVSATMAAIGVTRPPYLDAAFVVAAAGGLILLFDAHRTI